MSAIAVQPSTVLITGGGSGIGAGLAGALHARGATVIIAGRTLARLEAVAARYPGMQTEQVDVADADQVSALAVRIAERHPGLNLLINNAAIQTLIDFAQDAPIDPATIAQEIDINLKGLIMVSNAFLPLLKRQPSARLVHVSSGLGYVPLAAAPVYSATKAAVHSFTLSLRHQLAGGSVQVVELIPPVVESDLHRGQPHKPPGAMSLESFIKAAMSGLDGGRDEAPIGVARVTRQAGRIAPKFFFRLINQRRR